MKFHHGPPTSYGRAASVELGNATTTCSEQDVRSILASVQPAAKLNQGNLCHLDIRPNAPRGSDAVIGRLETPADPQIAIGTLRSMTLGFDLLTRQPTYVPVNCVVCPYHSFSATTLFYSSTNGLASGNTRLDALCHALCEVIERDAFMITWLQRLVAQPFDPLSHPHSDVRRIATAYLHRGARLKLARLPSDHEVAVFAGLIVQESAPFEPAVVVGLVTLAVAPSTETGSVKALSISRTRLRGPATRTSAGSLVTPATS